MEKKIGEGLGISGFTLGILSIIFAGLLGMIISVIGFIFCMVQQRKNPNKLTLAGIILNVIGFILSIIFVYVIFSGMLDTSQFPVY